MKQYINNILLLKANYIGNEYQKNFELIEGRENIENFSAESVYFHGDFCFVDYSNSGNVRALSDEQVAELLYLGHMYKPIRSPFFDVLNNNYVYLSHDDSFYCKLYCKDKMMFSHLIEQYIIYKIQEMYGYNISLDKNISAFLLKSFQKGVLFDFNDIVYEETTPNLQIYLIGKYDDMDIIYNNYNMLKKTGIRVSRGCFTPKNSRCTHLLHKT